MSSSFQTLPNPGPPQQIGQAGAVYPTSTTTSTASNDYQNSTPDHSSGSFGMVFVVLAIILVVSAVACVLGRFCGKKSDKSHKSHHQSKAHKQSKHSNQGGRNNNPNPNHNHMMNHHQSNNNSNHKGGANNNSHHKQHGGGGGRPKDRDLEFGYRSKEGDIMMGFDPKTRSIPSAKVAHNNGDFRVDSMGRGMESHHHGNPRDFRMDSMGRGGMEPPYHGHGNPRDFP